MNGRTGAFRRKDRLLRSREFRNVIQRGRRETARAFVVFALAGEDDPVPRLGITVSRRVGGAVSRNHVKRRVREWFRRRRAELSPGTRIVVIGRPGAAELSGSEIASLLDDAVRRTGEAAS